MRLTIDNGELTVKKVDGLRFIKRYIKCMPPAARRFINFQLYNFQLKFASGR